MGVIERDAWICPVCGLIALSSQGACVGEAPDKYHDPAGYRSGKVVPADAYRGAVELREAVENALVMWEHTREPYRSTAAEDMVTSLRAALTVCGGQ